MELLAVRPGDLDRTVRDLDGRAVPSMVFGHKGLATDRLDRPLDVWDSGGQNLFDTQRLEPGADTLVYANNRTLMPRLGRWLQSDPNASGAVVLSASQRHGRSIHTLVATLGLRDRTVDGLSLFQYARGNPTRFSDPSGLFGMPALAAGGAIGVGLLMPGPSDLITGALESLVTEYATRQEWDVDWASDWRMSDDSHSRTNDGWVAIAMGWGIYNSFEIGVGQYTTNLIDWVASANVDGSGGAGPLHHIMTDKNSTYGLRWTERYKLLLSDHGITGDPFEWKENKVNVPGHKGPHPDSYHSRVFNEIQDALRATPDPAIKPMVLRSTLEDIGNRIRVQGAATWDLDKPRRGRK